MGDPAGVGPEIIVRALSSSVLRDLADITVIGDKWVFEKVQGTGCRVQGSKLTLGTRHLALGANFIDLNNVAHKAFKFGKISANCGRASIQYIGKALQLIKDGELDCLVTCPISKEAAHYAGFPFPGHTEYLAKEAKIDDFVMMLMNKYIKVSLVTRHIPLKEVSRRLTVGNIYRTIVITLASLRSLFGIVNPRLAVCGLNPHASDAGIIGSEEGEIIVPAVAKSRRFSSQIYGPLPCDSVFASAIRGKYDAVIAMYHDQALMPLKLSDFDSGVNLTLGLPYARTSVLHGTAFDIAGKNIANPNSLIEAIKVAVKCAKNLKLTGRRKAWGSHF